MPLNFLNPADAERFVHDAFAGQVARLSHIVVVAERAERTAREIATRHPSLRLDVPTVRCAALLHDVGYLDGAQRTGFHQVDGYHFLCDHGAETLARRIVGHSSSPEEAGLRGIPLPEPLDDLAARLVTYWDMQVKQGGEIVGYDDRYRDILGRYGAESVVGRAHRLARPRLRTILAHVDRLVSSVEDTPNAGR